ncbi:MAG: amidohydrolase family protein [Chitinophagales bacterium]
MIQLVATSPGKYTAVKTINAAGKLVTHAFIDTHMHLTDVFGDYNNAPARISPDSIPYYRKKLSDTFGLSYFSETRDTTLTPLQLARCKENFNIFMGYAKKMYDKGIQLRIGTDCPYGGKALLSELLLLHEHGFSTTSILQIASLNGAKALGLDNQYGVIEKGKKANLLIWEKSPFVSYRNFLSSKTIIKEGVVLQ